MLLCFHIYLQLKILNKAKTDFLTAQDINNNMEADDNVNNTTLSRKRFVTRLSVSAKVVKHSEDTINIIPVKLCYKKNRSPIGSGRFGTVTAGKIHEYNYTANIYIYSTTII